MWDLIIISTTLTELQSLKDIYPILELHRLIQC